jgi:hypothetical protein
VRDGLAASLAMNLDRSVSDDGCRTTRTADINALSSKRRREFAVRGRDAQRALSEMWVSVAPLCRVMGQAPRNKPKRLGEKLLQIREALGLSQKEMAERLAERTGFKITHTHTRLEL